MSTLTVYDTRGNRYADGAATDESDESIKDLFYGGVRFAIETSPRLQITVFFRAKESENARSEQFYARFETRSENQYLSELLNALERTIEDDWGYHIDNSSDEMNLYRVLRDGQYEVPGSEVEHDVISDLIEQRKQPRVGVADEDNAIGLLNVFVSDYTSAAVTDSIQSNSISKYDLVVVPGEGSGVTPLGDTADEWTDAQESARESSMFDHINTVRSAVNDLSRTHGLSDDEIRSVVFGEVPALRPGPGHPTSDSGRYPTGVQQAVSEIQEAVSALSTGQGLSDAEVRQQVTSQVPTLKTTGSATMSATGSTNATSTDTAIGKSSGGGTYGNTEQGSMGDAFGGSSDSGGVSEVLPSDRGTIIAVAMVLAGTVLVGLVAGQLAGVITIF